MKPSTRTRIASSFDSAREQVDETGDQGRNLQKADQSFRAVTSSSKSGISLAAINTADTPSYVVSAKRQHSRSMRYRNSHRLKPWQVEELHRADAYARTVGLSLNRFCTIAWLLTDHGTLSAAAFQIGMKRVTQWFRDHGYPFAYIYVHENPVSRMGDDVPNTHILFHAPGGIRNSDLHSIFCVAFQSLDGGIDIRSRVERGHADFRLQYMTKGADDLTCRRFGGRRKAGGQGVVLIKRCGTSQNIGRAARSRAGRR
jgi:hypothetical protein